MFGLFKRKSKAEKLQEKYNSLMAESYMLSTKNRRESDARRAEAEEILDEIEFINNTQSA